MASYEHAHQFVERRGFHQNVNAVIQRPPPGITVDHRLLTVKASGAIHSEFVVYPNLELTSESIEDYGLAADELVWIRLQARGDSSLQTPIFSETGPKLSSTSTTRNHMKS